MDKLKAFLASVVCLLLISLTLPAQAVINGNLAQPQSMLARSTVLLSIENTKLGIAKTCTGFLVAEDLVMTAGHCLDRLDYDVWVGFSTTAVQSAQIPQYTYTQAVGYRSVVPVRATAAKQTPQAQASKANIRKQPTPANPHNEIARTWDRYFRAQRDWRDIAVSVEPNSYHDFALIRLKRALPADYRAIGFAADPHNLPFQTEVVAAGFGYSTLDRSDKDAILRYAKHKLVTRLFDSEGGLVGWEGYSFTHQAICSGDSGGPLFIVQAGQLRLLGINSKFTTNCTSSSWFVNPRYMKLWFENAARELGSSLRLTK